MIYFGRFHSNSDILIYTPEIRTLFVGDIFSKYGRPGMNYSSISDAEKWMQALQWVRIRTNKIGAIIDGHGQVLSMEDLTQFEENIFSRYSDNKNN